MVRTRVIQNNFTAGEFTPRLHARHDFPKYGNALEVFHNFVAFPHGGATRRIGTRFVKEVKDSDTLCRLIPFEFNVTQAYVCEFGDFYIRLYSLSGRLEEPLGTPVEVASPYAWSDVFGIQYAHSADTLYMVHPGHQPRKLQRTSATTFTLTPMESRDGPYLDENVDHDKRFHVTHTTGAITITAIGHAPFLPQHVGTTWRLNLGYGWGSVRIGGVVSSTVANGVVEEPLGNLFLIDSDGTNVPLHTAPGYDVLAQGIKFDTDIVLGHVEVKIQRFDSPAGRIWLELRQADLATNLPLADSIDVSVRLDIASMPATAGTWVEFEFDRSQTSPILNRGQQYYLVLRSDQGYSGTHYMVWRCSVGDAYGDGTGYIQDFGTKTWTDAGGDFAIRIQTTDDWREPAWSAWHGWPTAVCFFEQRLYFGKGTTFYGSVINDFESFAPSFGSDPPSANNAVSFTIASTQVNQIQWIAGVDELFIGTAGAEYRVTGANDSGITPNNPPLVREVSSYGSTFRQPIKVGKNLVYLGRSRTKLREVLFNLSEDSFTSVDLCLFSEHIGKRQFSQVTYQQDPDPMILGVLETGDIAAASYLRAQDVVGWSVLSTQGRFESIVCIPHPAGDTTQVWVIVKRGSKRYVEYFEDRDGQYGPLLVDSGLSYSGPPTSTLSGLDHLEGHTVAIIGDGAVYPNMLVSDGQITGLDPPVSSADVGLPYTSILKDLKPALNTQQGTLYGSPIGPARTTVTLLDSLGLTINGDVVPFRYATDPLDSAPPLFSGDKDVHTLGWDRDGQVTIEQAQPLPCTILAITRTVEVGEL